MKISVAVFASAVSAASIRAVQQTQGLPLSTFGEVHHISIADAIAKVDLLGNNFTDLPISTKDHPLSFGEEKVTSSKATAAAADTGDCANPNIRFEWDQYSASDKQAFVDALQCLINKAPSGNFAPSKNRYEDFVRLHQTYSPNIHSKSTTQQTHKFLLWHRYYVWALEQVMRDECGFNRAFPWWDEKKWAGKFAQATIFTSQYFGTLPGSTNGAATCIGNGRFSGMSLSLGPGMATNNPHCLQRAVNEQTTLQTGQSSWDTCMQRTSYPDFHSCVEFTFHAQGHNGVGGIMADAIASPGDPSFFMHHLYVDYAFRKWQIDDVSRRTTISGCADNVNCAPLTLDTMVYMGNICGAKCPDLKVRDILNTQQGHLCYRYNY
ncbi:Di-copper centre-containing protein [Hypoxylon rubiginosum]|uniref:Di-copper centre-containing protein n=1 Tax=Hypoxylon rubiginosum TaxID=110542 RepID=A0ACC0D8I2_9PEZI|nr:Di-copper centre-containing protein [Hypoxylon rubiginosum]